MADYAAAPLQPLAQALLTIDATNTPQITGRGFSSVARGAGPMGNFILTLDEGIGVADVGSGPDFTVGIIGPNGLDPRLARVAMTMRGGTTAPGTTLITDMSVNLVSVPGEGAQLEIALALDPATPADPMGAGVPNANGGGLEVMLWQVPTPDNVNVQVVGPLFQGAMQFP